MDLPDFAGRAAATGADGVGLCRLEIIIANGGIHPAEYIRQGKTQDYINLLKEGVGKIAKAFDGKPVWVRCSDLRSDEYRNLKGGDLEPRETDPMIGWHAIRRLLDEPAILKAEFEAIRELHYAGQKNVGIMLPFVINVDEVRRAKEILREVGLEPCKAIDFGVMIETPASCWIIEDLCKEGISFVSFGTNDLTQTTLGISRDDSGKFLNDYIDNKIFDVDPFVSIDQSGVGELVELASTRGRKVNKKLKLGICGEHGGDPKSIDFCSRTGLDYVSCSPFRVPVARLAAAQAELRK